MNSEIFLLTIFNSYFIVFENVLDILISLYFRNDLIIACFLTARRKELSFVYTTTYFCYMYTFIFYFLIHGYVLIESYFSVNFESVSSFGIHILYFVGLFVCLDLRLHTNSRPLNSNPATPPPLINPFYIYC